VAEQAAVESSARVDGSPVEILGVPVSTLSLADTVRRVVAWALSPEADRARVVCATTVHGLMEGWRDPGFRRILAEAAIVAADGMPLVWFGSLQGHVGMERVCGPTLMLRVCEASAALPIRHFFYGGVPGVGERLAATLGERFAGLQVAGCYCPPFRSLTEGEKQDVAARIDSAGTDIVWVGLGTPKQERWAAEMRSRLAAKVIITVGAAFDFHTGRVKRAPLFLQSAGLEWAFRLWQEPRRLWRRYVYNNPVFLWLALLQLAGLKTFTNADRAGREDAP